MGYKLHHGQQLDDDRCGEQGAGLKMKGPGAGLGWGGVGRGAQADIGFKGGGGGCTQGGGHGVQAIPLPV